MLGYGHKRDWVRHAGAKMKSMALCIVLGVLCILPVSYCSPVVWTTQSWANGEIDSDLREHIHELNNNVVHFMKSDDSAALFEMMADTVKQTMASKEQIQTFVHDSLEAMRDAEFDIHAEYYWKRKGSGEGLCIIKPAVAGDFRIEIEGVSDEMYFSFLKSNDEFRKPMIGLAYMKSGAKWRIYSLRIGIVEVAGKNAPEWYAEAKDLYDRGYLLPAVLRQQMASACVPPDVFWHYEQEAEIIEFSEDLQSEINQSYTFPIEMSDLAGKPTVYGIEPQFLQMRMLPKVSYVTTHPFEDVQALEAEAQAMTPELQELFPGITIDASHLLFSAFSEPPLDPSKLYVSYGVVVEIEPAEKPE